MRALAKKIYHRLPSGLRGGFNPGLRFLALVRGLRPEVYLVEGTERSSGQPLSMICAAESRERAYLCRLTLADSWRERFLGRTWLWNLARLAKRRGRDCSLLWVEIKRKRRKYLKQPDCYWIPTWLMGVVELPYPPEVERNERLRSDIRRMARYGLAYEITRDPGRLEDFFHNMYVPYIKGAHGSSAHLRTYQTVLDEFEHCELLLVRREGRDVAGCLISYDPKGPRIWLAGIRDGDRDALMAGTASSLFHFASLYLQEKGHRQLRFGLSRAFFRDGVFHFKKKWAQRVFDSYDDYFALRVLRHTPSAQAFLLANPFIFENDGSLVGAVFAESAQPLSDEALRRIEKSHTIPGLSRLQVFRLTGPEERPDGCVTIELRADSPPAAPLPAAHP